MPPKAKKKPEAKPTSLAAFRATAEKRYGSAIVRRDQVRAYSVVSTGSLTLDLALRTGGWVEGRMHEIVGVEGVGKTTLAIAGMIEAQKKHPKKAVGYIDMEQTFDYDWAEELGLDTSDDRFVHFYPDDAEDVSDMLRKQADSGFFSMIVVDSIGGMESKEAFEKDAEKKVMGTNAQIITRMVKACAVTCRKNQVTAILINQLRANIDNPMGQDISAGPKALKYSTTTKVILRHTSDERVYYRIPGDKDDVEIGRKIRALVARSKVSVQGANAEFYLFNYDTREYGPIGIDRADEAVNIGTRTNVFIQKGSWYDLPGITESRFNGRAKLLAHLRSCPEDLEAIRVKAVASMAADVHEEVETTFEGVDA